MKYDFPFWNDMRAIFRYSNITRGRLVFNIELRRRSKKFLSSISKEFLFLSFGKTFEDRIWYQTSAKDLRLEALDRSKKSLKKS